MIAETIFKGDIELPVVVQQPGWIGAYPTQRRMLRIERFITKRRERVWEKVVKYDVRKSFADQRLRVKGRFVKKEDEVSFRPPAVRVSCLLLPLACDLFPRVMAPPNSSLITHSLKFNTAPHFIFSYSTFCETSCSYFRFLFCLLTIFSLCYLPCKSYYFLV